MGTIVTIIAVIEVVDKSITTFIEETLEEEDNKKSESKVEAELESKVEAEPESKVEAEPESNDEKKNK
jgi:hypothetical protein